MCEQACRATTDPAINKGGRGPRITLTGGPPRGGGAYSSTFELGQRLVTEAIGNATGACAKRAGDRREIGVCGRVLFSPFPHMSHPVSPICQKLILFFQGEPQGERAFAPAASG